MASPYELAREAYAVLGVDTEKALAVLARNPISVHCWQGDDVGGFESTSAGDPGGGLAVTGNHPGRARTPEELRADLEKVFSLVPGKHRLNLHAFYLESGGAKIDRDQIETKHFQGWIDWAKSLGIGMDFNPTCFAHPKAADGFTLAHRDRGIRDFWIEHARRCRTIGADIGRALSSACVVNVWIPDGYKDLPANRLGPRQRLVESLDAIFAEKLPTQDEIDAVECKLFGIGSESYVAGSHEFYLGYAVSRQKAVCLDAGHFHPTETLADKISSVLLFVPRLLLHVSRGVRWDSDHVVILDDPTRAVMEELVRGDFLGRTSIGLDYFDASINRVAAWVIGIRATQKALLLALLEPSARLRQAEEADDYTTRLALLEEAKALPWGIVWNEFCCRSDVPDGPQWLAEVSTYGEETTRIRG
ncbi:MAG: L-rhamnose isomerase [Chthoniobacterales bacterium]